MKGKQFGNIEKFPQSFIQGPHTYKGLNPTDSILNQRILTHNRVKANQGLHVEMRRLNAQVTMMLYNSGFQFAEPLLKEVANRDSKNQGQVPITPPSLKRGQEVFELKDSCWYIGQAMAAKDQSTGASVLPSQVKYSSHKNYKHRIIR